MVNLNYNRRMIICNKEKYGTYSTGFRKSLQIEICTKKVILKTFSDVEIAWLLTLR